MCRNIKNLYNFDPAATDLEIQNAAMQFVRKVTGSSKPSQQNQVMFDRAVSEISVSVQKLLETMMTSQPLKNREVEAAKAKQKAMLRFNKT